MVDTLAGGLLLGGGLEEELVDLADRQTLGQVIKGAVFLAAVVARAVALATAGETLHQRSAQGVGTDLDLGQEEAFALAQGEGGFVRVMYPSHI
jgi:hypothetical protein